jgi:acyl-coenzyme A synthetase/AMP-(fatty) acid ligase
MSVLAAGGHISPVNPAFNVQEFYKLLQLSKSKYIIAHPANLPVAFEAAQLAGIPKANIWTIKKDPENRASYWKDILVREGQEADPMKFTVEQSKNALAYLCFSSGTTGNITAQSHSVHILIQITHRTS